MSICRHVHKTDSAHTHTYALTPTSVRHFSHSVTQTASAKVSQHPCSGECSCSSNMDGGMCKEGRRAPSHPHPKTPTAAAAAAGIPPTPHGNRQGTTAARATKPTTQARASRTAARPPRAREQGGTEGKRGPPQPNQENSPPAAPGEPNAGPHRRGTPTAPDEHPTTTQEFRASPRPNPRYEPGPPQGRPAPHSRQPSARPTVGPGRSKAGARRPRPGGGNPGEKRGPTRGVVNMARPGSATVGSLAGPSAQEQGPEPTPQGHQHPRLRCNVNPPTARREHRRAQEAGTPGTLPPLQRGPYPPPGKRQGTDGPRSHLPCKMCVRICVFKRVCVCMCVCLCWNVYIEGGGVCVLRGVQLKLAGRALQSERCCTPHRLIDKVSSQSRCRTQCTVKM
ncbi:uncharacterized protein LOC144992278 [Oryzias latipes]